MNPQIRSMLHTKREKPTDKSTASPEFVKSSEHQSTNDFTQPSLQNEDLMCRQVSINSNEGKTDNNLSQYTPVSKSSTSAPKPTGNDIFSLSFCDSSDDDTCYIDNISSIFRLENNDVGTNLTVSNRSQTTTNENGLIADEPAFDDNDVAPNIASIDDSVQNNESDNDRKEKSIVKLVDGPLKQEKIQTSLVTLAPKKKFCYSDIVSTLLPRERVFKQFKFLISPLKAHMLAVRKKSNAKPCEGSNDPYFGNNETELIAKRRLKSAVLAFGGNFGSFNEPRVKNNSASRKGKKPKVDGYEASLANRYYENCGRLSWDVEEPPLDFMNKNMDTISDSDFLEKALNLEASDGSVYNGFLDRNDSIGSFSFSEEECCKKYRCRLCGKAKQNHVCRYQHALERSIGTMVYPSLNAFECEEPGSLAPTLSEMNNFTDLIDSAKEEKANTKVQSMEIGSGNETEDQKQTKSNCDANGTDNEICSLPLGSKRKLFSISDNEKSDLVRDELFLNKTAIRIEQYRTVNDYTQDDDTVTEKRFRYPTVPLTMAHRTSMSKFLFDLCQQTDCLTEICTEVLSKTRETESWDLVVAELITQALVLMHCPPDDKKLDGLRDFLLTIGIST